MAQYTWETGISRITGTCHPTSQPIAKPWAFFCDFTVMLDSPTGQYQGVCEASETSMILTLEEAWLYSKTVLVVANDKGAPPPYLKLESVKIVN